MTETSFHQAPSLKVWDLPTRLFHWTLVAAIAAAFLSSEEEGVLAEWHQPAGWVAGVLIVFRLVWGFLGGEHARFGDFLRPGRLASHLGDLLRRRPAAEPGHNPLGALAVVTMLGLIAASVATGIAALTGGADDLHEAVAYGLLAVIGVHVAGVIVMSLATRENLVRAMVTGRKSRERHPGATDARPAPTYALPLAGLAIAAAVLGAMEIDPQAFLPHAHAEVDEERAALEPAEHDDD